MKIIKVILIIYGLHLSSDGLAVSEDSTLNESIVTSYKSYNPNRDDLDDVALDEQREQIIAYNNQNRAGEDNFSLVLTDLLQAFAKDLRKHQVDGLKNLSIRKVTVNSTIPKSYEEYLEFLVAEQIRENANVRIISCISCKSKNTKIIDNKLYISTPSADVEQIKRTADELGIDYFVDVMLLYQKSHMILGFQIFNTATQELVWSRVYNSETLHSRFQAMAVDYKQVVHKDMKEDSDEYIPSFRVAFGAGAGSYRDPSTGSANEGMMALQIRGTEKFNNRLNEFGMLLTGNLSIPTLMQGDNVTVNSETGVEKLKYTVGLFAIYAHNFLKPIEFYDRVRWGLNFAVGGHFSNNYLAPAVRTGVDIFFGKSFFITPAAFYIGRASVIVDDDVTEVDGGFGGELIVSFNI